LNHFFLLLFLLNINLLNSSQYIWPTDDINAITTTFGEPRSKRFHAGIDVRTYGALNKKIYAIDSGYIYRINISPNKYGKAIYLKLNDGNIILYSHLNKFNEKITDLIHRLNMKFNENFFDYELNENEKIKLNKGDVIGYTGDTGSLTGPHLHFEIRDSLNNPINPLKYYNTFDDTIKPIINEIAFIPLSNNTWINNIQDYNIIKPKKINEYKYVIEDTVSIIGQFGIAINAFDKVHNQPFDFGVYKIELFIDNELLYSINFDKYSFTQDNLIYNEVDYHLIQKGSVFHRLFSSNKNKLNFIEINNPFILLDDNYHNMIINISDINNNKIQLQGIILGKMLTNNNIFSFVDSNNTTIKFHNENTTINLKSRFKDQDNNLSLTSLINSKQINIDQLVPPYDIIEHYYSNSWGISSRKEYLSFRKLNPYKINGSVLLKHLDNGIIIEFEEDLFSGYNPTLELLTDNNKKVHDLYRKEKNLLSSKLINILEFENVKKINVIYNSTPNLVFEKKINGFITNKKGDYYFKKLNFKFNSNTFANNTCIWIEENKNIHINNYEIIVEPFLINPNTIPYNNPISITYNYNNCKNCSFYKYNDNNKWKIIDSNFYNNSITAEINTSGTYALLKEINQPVISNLKPSLNSKYSSDDVKQIIFNIKDELSGINPYNINILLNNNKLFYDYISYRNLVLANINQELEPGIQSLKIEISDNVGNKKSMIGEFIILDK